MIKFTLALAVFATTAVLAISADALALRPLLENGTRAVYKPRSFCPANHSCFHKAHWKSWGRMAVAYAQGYTVYPGGTPTRGRAQVSLSRPRHVCGGVRYTRARWRYLPKGQWTHSIFEPFSAGITGCGYWTGA